MSANHHQFTRVTFNRFKAFRAFTLRIRHFNILVGPNNSGKSTVLTAFRILASAMRRANRRKPEPVSVLGKRVLGYAVDLSAISAGEENIFYNYDDTGPASVTFTISNGNTLTLHFPEQGVCHLLAEGTGGAITTPAAFRSNFRCAIGFVPILGPVEHNEKLYEKEAARLALFNYRAARNFRNIWFHYPEKFEMFRTLLQQTWPGMDIEPPKVNASHDPVVLHMFCPEERIPREIFWAGFGFQVWCQMLTHLVQSDEDSIFLIDEPDIYLHSDLQRQLLGLLRSLGPDIVIATHSTEIITEAEADDIVLINKCRRAARQIKEPLELIEVFSILGSNLNPILTQLSKTRAAVFVEGKDFQVFSKFARKLGVASVGNRSSFAVVPVGGFSPDRIRSLKEGIEATLGGRIRAAVVLDRDYRSEAECSQIAATCRLFCDLVVVHKCKEVENFLLVPTAIDRAAARKVADRNRRTGKKGMYAEGAEAVLGAYAASQKNFVVAQHLTCRRRFDRMHSPSHDEATSNQAALEGVNTAWATGSLQLVSGKEAMSAVNRDLQGRYLVSITPTALIDAMLVEEVPEGMKTLISQLAEFAA